MWSYPLPHLLEKTNSYIKYSNHYVDLIKGKMVDLEDMIVSFDVT